MALYRTIYMDFWKDTKIVDDFTPEEKYFMLYCLTNDYTNLCGCFEISIKQMAIDTGYNSETIERLLERFEKVHKIILYNKENKEMLIRNWYKYNWTKSEKLNKPLLKELENIKTPDFKAFISDKYNKRDTVSIPYTYTMDTTVADAVADTVADTDSEIENEKKENKYSEIVDIYNSNCTNLPKVKQLTSKRRTAINKFLREITLEQFEEICMIANDSEFLTGKNDRGWKADFDFLMRIDKSTSILEGKYNTEHHKTQDTDVLDNWLKKMEEKEKNYAI